MDLSMFQNSAQGTLVPIVGSDPRHGPWRHSAFVPTPLPDVEPTLTPSTYRVVADARAALAALDSTARQLPNPGLLRLPTLRREAQSTSALEGTYAPLDRVLVADEDEPPTPELVEILNYVRAANHGFAWVMERRPVSMTFLTELQHLLMLGTPLAPQAGRLRDHQVVIGRRPDSDPGALPVHNARFVPTPPGDGLEAGMRDLVDWLNADHRAAIDPVVAAAMSHYQLETLHPFNDGNGRIGRLLIVVHLVGAGVLMEPTLTVSPWFEARRGHYYDKLLGVSTVGAWDAYVAFFAEGLREAADRTRDEMLRLVDVQNDLKAVVRASTLRADSAHALVDLAVAHPVFTVRDVETTLGISYGRANKLVGQLCDLGVLKVVDAKAYKRLFYAPRVHDVILTKWSS